MSVMTPQQDQMNAGDYIDVMSVYAQRGSRVEVRLNEHVTVQASQSFG